MTAPFGDPIVTFSRPRPSGPATIADGPVTATGTPTLDRQIQDVGDPVDVVTIVPGTPVTTMRTELGTPTAVDTPGTRGCRKISNGKSKGDPPVQRCERTVVTTTTTPTTIFTTVTTPRTERTVSTQAREECVTTTQQTSFERVTTQPQEQDRTVSFRQRTTTTTTTTTFRFTNAGVLTPVVFAGGAPNPRVQVSTAPSDPFVQSFQTITLPARITRATIAGEPIVTGPVCAATTAAITTTNRTLEPVVVTTSAPGAPIVSVRERGTGDDCIKNPSTAEQRANACA